MPPLLFYLLRLQNDPLHPNQLKMRKQLLELLLVPFPQQPEKKGQPERYNKKN
jgi:hypothetical protein